MPKERRRWRNLNSIGSAVAWNSVTDANGGADAETVEEGTGARPAPTVLRGLARRTAEVAPESPCADVHAWFKQHPEASSVVVRLGLTTPALVVKHRFMLTMSGHYGWSLYHKRPIQALAELRPLILAPDTGLTEAVGAVLDRDPDRRYDDVLLRERRGALVGVISVAALLERLGHLHAEQATAALRALTAEREATAALRASEALRGTVLANSPLVVFHVDLWGTVTLAEGQGLTPFGLPPEAIAGRSVAELAWNAPELARGYQSARGGKAAAFEVHVAGRVLDTVFTPVRGDRDIVNGVTCVATDVTTREQAQVQLRDALAREHATARRLREIDEQQRTFLQAVAHDLRTPLASILGIALTVQRRLDDLAGDERADLLDRLAGNARKLDQIVGDLLDLDRLTGGRIEPERRPVDAAALARRVLDGTDLLDGHPVELDAEPVTALLDPTGTERILDNLLANAARHTPPGTPVWLTIRATGGPDPRTGPPARDNATRPAVPTAPGVLFTVADGGPGIPAELRDRIFQPFSRGPSVGAAPGSGVGLALVAKFAELHGGHAWVADRPGGGAAFHVWLATPPGSPPDTAPPDTTPAGPPPDAVPTRQPIAW